MRALADRVLAVHAGTTTEFTDRAAFAHAKGELLPARFLAGARR